MAAWASYDMLREIACVAVSAVPGWAWLLDVDDLTHDAVLSLGEGEKKSRSYLSTKIHWKILDTIKSSEARPLNMDILNRTGTEDGAFQDVEDSLDDHIFFSALPEQHREMCLLRARHWGYQRLADHFGVSTSTIGRQVDQVRGYLR